MTRLRKRSGHMFGLSTIAALAAVVIVACHGDISFGPQGPSVRKCAVNLGNPWNLNGTSFQIDKPASCPIKLGGVTRIDYAATGRFPIGTTSQQYQLTITTRTGGFQQAFVSSGWTIVGVTEVVVVAGNYFAATGGFDGNNHGFDLANNQIMTSSGWKAITGTIDYDFGMPGLTLIGVDSIGAGVPYTVEALINDANFLPPVSWEWRIDGTLHSTSAGPFTGTLTTPGQVHTVTARAVDGNGVIHLKDHFVTACSGTAINC